MSIRMSTMILSQFVSYATYDKKLEGVPYLTKSLSFELKLFEPHDFKGRLAFLIFVILPLPLLLWLLLL